MKGSLEYCRYAFMRNTILTHGLERKNRHAHAHFHTGFIIYHWEKHTHPFTNALLPQWCHLHDHNHTVHPFYHRHFLIASLPLNRTYCYVFKCSVWEDICSLCLFLDRRASFLIREAANVLAARQYYERGHVPQWTFYSITNEKSMNFIWERCLKG